VLALQVHAPDLIPRGRNLHAYVNLMRRIQHCHSFFFDESRDFISINHHSVIQEGSPATYVGRLQEYNQLFYAALHSTLPLMRRPVVRGLFFHGCENRAQPASNFGESGVVPADGHVLLLICHGPMDYIDLRRVTLVLRRLR
jgi:hypothetical protein